MANNSDIPLRSMSAVRAGDKAGWLALFEHDAVVEDPVGGHAALDPTGEGQRGIEAIAKFYDIFSAGQEAFDFEIVHVADCGNEVACFALFTMTIKGGMQHKQNMIVVYRISSAGRIASLRAFWR